MSLTLELLGPSPDLAELGAGEHNDGGGLYLTRPRQRRRKLDVQVHPVWQGHQDGPRLAE